MNKEEIFEKSRGDNHGVDERFMLDYQRMSTIMLTVVMVVWACLFFWDFFHGQNVSGLNALMLSGIATMVFYRAYRLRSKSQFILGLLVSCCAVSLIISHVLATM